jgi:hypothetical protein
MKHIKSFQQLNESSYYNIISEYPFLMDDDRFNEYVIENNLEDENDIHKIGYEELLRLTHEWMALNHNLMQNTANPNCS